VSLPAVRPTRKAPIPPYLFKQSEGYSLQEAAENEETENELQDFNFLPIYASKVRDQAHSLFLGDSPVFGIVVVAILHPEVGRKKGINDRRLMMHKFSRKSSKNEDEDEEDNIDDVPMDVFIRGVPGDVFFSIPVRGLKPGYNRRQLIKEFQEHVKDYQDTTFELIKDPQLTIDLGIFEQNLFQKKFKFGILLRTQEAANDENAIFSIKHTTPDFDELLEFLGERVTLQGFKKYNVGLDTSANLDGTHSVYTIFREFEVMWHACPLLLYSDNNPQQIQRKRHIGNDVCVLIFDEADTPLDPNLLTSKFNHVQLIVKKKKDMSDDKKTFYEIGVASKKGVGHHLPLPPKSRIFEKGADFREFLYTKMINAERASYLALAFAKAISRTREGLLKALIWDKYHHE